MDINEAVRACQAYIHENLDKDLTLETLAERYSFSPSYLRKSFRKYAGVSIGKYIQNARLSRAAHDLIHGLCIVSEAAQLSGYSSVFSFSKTFCRVLGVPPSSYIGAEGLPIIRIQVPTTVAGYILHRTSSRAEPGLALWHGHDFSGDDPADFSLASPEGGAEVGLWMELDGEQCYLFGVCCREDAAIPEGMQRFTLPPVTWAMFPVPAGTNTQELCDNLHAALAASAAHFDEAGTYEPVPDAPVMEYYHGGETYLCIAVRETRRE